MAVARFLGREFGLAGATNVENALMDAAVDAISDATEKQYTAYLFEKVRDITQGQLRLPPNHV
jgi:hypothetical protein